MTAAEIQVAEHQMIDRTLAVLQQAADLIAKNTDV